MSFHTSSPKVRTTMRGVRYDGATMSRKTTPQSASTQRTNRWVTTYRTPSTRSSKYPGRTPSASVRTRVGTAIEASSPIPMTAVTTSTKNTATIDEVA